MAVNPRSKRTLEGGLSMVSQGLPRPPAEHGQDLVGSVGSGGLCLLAPPGSGLPHSRHRQRCPWALLAGQEGAGRGHVVKEGGELWHAFKNYSLKNCFLKQRKVIEGTIFLYFLIKCHLLAEKQLAVSCTAGG